MDSLPPLTQNSAKQTNPWFVLVGGFLIVCGVWTTIFLTVWMQGQIQPENPTSVKSLPASHHYRLSKLKEDWKRDPVQSADRLAGKRIELTGVVLQFQRRQYSGALQACVALGDHDTTGIMDFTNCFFNDDEPWCQVAPEQEVQLTGEILPLKTGEFVLMNCRIESVTGESCPRMTADELSMALRTGEFERRYPQRSLLKPVHVILSGRIRTIRQSRFASSEAGSDVEVVLESPGDEEMTCLFEETAVRVPSEQDIGRTITVVGLRQGPLPEFPVLQRCFRVDRPKEPRQPVF